MTIPITGRALNARYKKLNDILKRRAKWVKALRSGKYKQGFSQLYRPLSNTYCCLGVADKVCELDTGPNIEHVETLDEEAARKMGLTQAQQNRLARLNDAHGKTFAQIADAIEKMPITKKVLKP